MLLSHEPASVLYLLLIPQKFRLNNERIVPFVQGYSNFSNSAGQMVKQKQVSLFWKHLVIIVCTHAREAIGSASACADCLDSTWHERSA